MMECPVVTVCRKCDEILLLRRVPADLSTALSFKVNKRNQCGRVCAYGTSNAGTVTEPILVPRRLVWRIKRFQLRL